MRTECSPSCSWSPCSQYPHLERKTLSWLRSQDRSLTCSRHFRTNLLVGCQGLWYQLKSGNERCGEIVTYYDLLVLLFPQVGVVDDPLQEDDPLCEQESLVGLQPFLLRGELQQLEYLGTQSCVANQAEVEEDVVQSWLEPADSISTLERKNILLFQPQSVQAIPWACGFPCWGQSEVCWPLAWRHDYYYCHYWSPAWTPLYCLIIMSSPSKF